MTQDPSLESTYIKLICTRPELVDGGHYNEMELLYQFELS